MAAVGHRGGIWLPPGVGSRTITETRVISPHRRAIMGLMDWAKGQFIDIIEWTEPSQNEILAHRFTRHKNEIKNGAKLVVREGQAAGFVKEGQLADVKMPGMYTLDTKNMPVLSTIL